MAHSPGQRKMDNMIRKLQSRLNAWSGPPVLEPQSVMGQGSNAMKVATLALLVAGCMLLVYIGLRLDASPLSLSDPGRTYGMLILALVPMLHRGLLRKFYFGSGLSLHQALSFEVMFHFTRWFSPLLPSKAFQVAFHTRETGHGRTASLRWQSLYSGSAYVAMTLVGAIALALSGQWVLAGLAAIVTVNLAMRGYYVPRSEVDVTRTFLYAWIGLAASWILEAVIFAVIARGVLNVETALVTWIAVTLLTHRPTVPLCLGIIQLPVLLLSGAAGAATLAMINSFVLVKSLVLAGMGLLYMARYKLQFRDLFSTRIIGYLLRSQRPRGGWPMDADVANAPVTLSVVIPAYNEEDRLPPYLDEVCVHLENQPFDWEIIVVDDGSRDRTCEIVEQAGTDQSRIKLVRQTVNQGKGAAVARGVKEARGKYVLFADADGATPADQIDTIMATLEMGTEIVVGSRTINSEEVSRARDVARRFLGMMFYRMTNFFAVPGVSDTQCGFKGFRRDVARHLFSELNEQRWAFDIEVLYRAQMLGYAITEVPVNWSEIPGSKLNPVADGLRMTGAVFRIRHQNAGFLRRRETHWLSTNSSPAGTDS